MYFPPIKNNVPPTAANLQPVHLITVQEKVGLERIGKGSNIYGAPLWFLSPSLINMESLSAPVSCHVILFQPRLNHKRRVKRNNQREYHNFYFHVFDVYSFRKIILFLFLSGGGLQECAFAVNEKKIDCVILGLLSHEELTGYEIKKRMDTTLKYFWSASYGSISPALNDLVHRGLAMKREELNRHTKFPYKYQNLPV